MAINLGSDTVHRMQRTIEKEFSWPSSEECKENPHRPECKDRPTVPKADESAGYADGFCNCHDFAEPLVHANGTDIAWPSHYTQEMADAWRASHGLARPADESIAPS
jgi:hypothetical protein